MRREKGGREGQWRWTDDEVAAVSDPGALWGWRGALMNPVEHASGLAQPGTGKLGVYPPARIPLWLRVAPGVLPEHGLSKLLHMGGSPAEVRRTLVIGEGTVAGVHAGYCETRGVF